MSGFASTTPSTSNPFGLGPNTQALMQSLAGMGQALGATSPNSAAYARGSPGMAYSQGQPNNLLETILQMRAAQSLGLGAPYQQGTAMPRVSLLSG